MSESIPKTGGRFLVEPFGATPAFSREQFSEDHRDIESMVKEFAKERIRENMDNIEKFDKDLSLGLIKEMGELGLLGVDVPEQYGGMELDKITTAIVAEAMSAGFSASFTTTWSVQTGIGCLPIVWFGTPEQKEKYLPKLVSGEWIGAYGLTEPSSGSDATNAKTKAILSEDGKHYLLTGEKQFITNGDWADVYIIFAQVDGSKFSAFIVDRDTPGFTIGPEEKKMGIKGSSTTSLQFTDAKVPAENLLYEIGKGAAIAFNVLNMGRFKLAASGLGGSKEILTEAVNYALSRKQFGQSISNFDVIRGKIADMAVRIYAADSMIYRTIGQIQEAIDELDHTADDYYLQMGKAMEQYAIEASMAKVYGSETLGLIADHGIQIFGGYGFIEEYPMAKAYRDTRIDRIWEGSNEINRQIISGYMLKKALTEELPIRDAIRRINTFMENGKLENIPEALKHEVDAVETGKRLTLYLFHEAMCEFGQDLRHEQQLTEILANMFTDIYTSESVLARVNHLLRKGESDSTILAIAKVQTAESSIRLLNTALTGFNGIYHGHLPESIIDFLRSFQARMLPRTDIIGLKRHISEAVYHQKAYPY
ncbi:MAG: acyl-CoA dehydrogenase family protein [Candidatus Marinimicrobia bacterium]|nr:acyl-CoA dehydrogenase family protein [Candidatus Neomarinimicrobiota bacterium]